MLPTRINSRRGPGTGKCFVFGWVGAWALGIYLAAAGLWLTDVARVAAGPKGFAAIMAIADAMSAPAKLAFGLLLGAALLVMRKIASWKGRRRQMGDSLAGAGAMVIVLAFLPESWSDGFGIGLVGTRFAIVPTLVYLAAAAIAALIAEPLESACLRNRRALNQAFEENPQ